MEIILIVRADIRSNMWTTLSFRGAQGAWPPPPPPERQFLIDFLAHLKSWKFNEIDLPKSEILNQWIRPKNVEKRRIAKKKLNTKKNSRLRRADVKKNFAPATRKYFLLICAPVMPKNSLLLLSLILIKKIMQFQPRFFPEIYSKTDDLQIR